MQSAPTEPHARPSSARFLTDPDPSAPQWAVSTPVLRPHEARSWSGHDSESSGERMPPAAFVANCHVLSGLDFCAMLARRQPWLGLLYIPEVHCELDDPDFAQIGKSACLPAIYMGQ